MCTVYKVTRRQFGPGWRKLFNLFAGQLTRLVARPQCQGLERQRSVNQMINVAAALGVDHDGSAHSHNPLCLFLPSFLTTVISQLQPTTSFAKVTIPQFSARNNIGVDGKGGMNLKLVKNSDGTNEARTRSQPKPNDKGKGSVSSPFGKSNHPNLFNYFE